MTLNNEETVTISASEYDGLIEQSCWLAALEAAGVDNWEGYDEARQILMTGHPKNLMADNNENKLTEIVKHFVEQHQIREVYDIYQRDSVIVSAYHLIHKLVETVGYHKD